MKHKKRKGPESEDPNSKKDHKRVERNLEEPRFRRAVMQHVLFKRRIRDLDAHITALEATLEKLGPEQREKTEEMVRRLKASRDKCMRVFLKE